MFTYLLKLKLTPISGSSHWIKYQIDENTFQVNVGDSVYLGPDVTTLKIERSVLYIPIQEKHYELESMGRLLDRAEIDSIHTYLFSIGWFIT